MKLSNYCFILLFLFITTISWGDLVTKAEDIDDVEIITLQPEENDGEIDSFVITERVLPDSEARQVEMDTEFCEEGDFEKQENELIESALLAKANRIDNVTVTYYCPCKKCCGKWAGGNTASGTKPREGVTVAVDRSLIPLGSEVMLDDGDGEIEYRIAEDTGVKGSHVDVFVSDHQTALRNGMKKATIYWIAEEY